MATVVITRDITVDTIPGIMGVTIPDITAATSTGGLTTATDTSTRPDTGTTTATAIMAASIADKKLARACKEHQCCHHNGDGESLHSKDASLLFFDGKKVEV